MDNPTGSLLALLNLHTCRSIGRLEVGLVRPRFEAPTQAEMDHRCNDVEQGLLLNPGQVKRPRMGLKRGQTATVSTGSFPVLHVHAALGRCKKDEENIREGRGCMIVGRMRGPLCPVLPRPPLSNGDICTELRTYVMYITTIMYSIRSASFLIVLHWCSLMRGMAQTIRLWFIEACPEILLQYVIASSRTRPGQEDVKKKQRKGKSSE
jgi:hypothetical protein